MKQQVEIHFTSSGLIEGFGFLCMKAAYDLEIHGRMFYGNSSQITIQAIGEKVNLNLFIKRVKALTTGFSSVNINPFDQLAENCREFDIFHSNNGLIGSRDQEINQHK